MLYSNIIPVPDTNAATAINQPTNSMLSDAVLGAFLSTALPDADAGPVVLVQLLPHPYPVGQQPPPWFAGQLNHPVAQLPLSAAKLAPDGATIVTPLLVSTVFVGAAGHEVEWQSRSTRQQPPL